MTKKKGLFEVSENIKGILAGLPGSDSDTPKIVDKPKEPSDKERGFISILEALEIVTRQMEVSGYRSRTISDYIIHVEHFQGITKVKNVADITGDAIYCWLDSMGVSNQTKLTRLKCLKAFLSR
ncbi:hypothetical protein ACQCVE_06775 [Metabacillus sp. 113a]|uniref:hypothetical protein n=1 Tax=Metabacillus sp. 113a TaxID=3404706 RepID=UPI003CF1BB16